MTDQDADDAGNDELKARYAQLLKRVQPVIDEGMRLILEEGVAVEDLRFEIRPSDSPG